MAYSISLHTNCDREGCNKGAEYAVYGTLDGDCYGNYCSQHTKERLKTLSEIELKGVSMHDRG